MEDKYPLALKALRDTVEGLDSSGAALAAHAADLFLEQQSVLIPEPGVDHILMAKALFIATAVLLAIRDNSADDVHHLVDIADEDGGPCDEEGCEFDHDDDLDTSYLGGQIDGMDSMIAALAGVALAVADSEAVDFDNIDWTQPAPPRDVHQSDPTEDGAEEIT